MTPEPNKPLLTVDTLTDEQVQQFIDDGEPFTFNDPETGGTVEGYRMGDTVVVVRQEVPDERERFLRADPSKVLEAMGRAEDSLKRLPPRRPTPKLSTMAVVGALGGLPYMTPGMLLGTGRSRGDAKHNCPGCGCDVGRGRPGRYCQSCREQGMNG